MTSVGTATHHHVNKNDGKVKPSVDREEREKEREKPESAIMLRITDCKTPREIPMHIEPIHGVKVVTPTSTYASESKV
jgi:hypothetical protein